MCQRIYQFVAFSGSHTHERHPYSLTSAAMGMDVVETVNPATWWKESCRGNGWKVEHIAMDPCTFFSSPPPLRLQLSSSGSHFGHRTWTWVQSNVLHFVQLKRRLKCRRQLAKRVRTGDIVQTYMYILLSIYTHIYIYICISGEKRVRGRVGIYPPLGAMISRLSLDEKLSRWGGRSGAHTYSGAVKHATCAIKMGQTRKLLEMHFVAYEPWRGFKEWNGKEREKKAKRLENQLSLFDKYPLKWKLTGKPPKGGYAWEWSRKWMAIRCHRS